MLRSRFNPDGECFSDMADHVCTYFSVPLFPEHELRAAKSITDYMDLFRQRGLMVRLIADWRSFMFPKNWRRIWRCNHLQEPRLRLADRCPPVPRAAVLHHCTSARLYGRREEWAHVVGEFWKDGGWWYYDGLLAQLREEDPAMSSYVPPAHDELIRTPGTKIMMGLSS